MKNNAEVVVEIILAAGSLIAAIVKAAMSKGSE